MKSKRDYSIIKYYILKIKLTIIGYFKEKKFKKNATYIGGRWQRPSIYMGNRKFYETITITVPGFCYFNNKPIEYKYWEIGMFKWTESDINVKTEKEEYA